MLIQTANVHSLITISNVQMCDDIKVHFLINDKSSIIVK